MQPKVSESQHSATKSFSHFVTVIKGVKKARPELKESGMKMKHQKLLSALETGCCSDFRLQILYTIIMMFWGSILNLTFKEWLCVSTKLGSYYFVSEGQTQLAKVSC